MHPALVLVHGIGSVRRADEEVSAWVSALARGAVAAGHARFAREQLPCASVRFADYSQLLNGRGFPGAQGTESAQLRRLDPAELNLVQELLSELINEQMDRTPDPQVAGQLVKALSRLTPAGQEQGPGDVVRRLLSAVTALLDVRPLATGAQWASSRDFLGQLAQAGRYLTRCEADECGQTLDTRIRKRVLQQLPDGPAVIVAHSLGSIVALESYKSTPAPCHSLSR